MVVFPAVVGVLGYEEPPLLQLDHYLGFLVVTEQDVNVGLGCLQDGYRRHFKSNTVARIVVIEVLDRTD